MLERVEGQGRARDKGSKGSERAGWPRTANEKPISRPMILRDRPMYGPVMRPCPLVCGPVNEAGVIFLFGVMAEKLGFVVLRIQTEFPDCEALRHVDEEDGSG